ncbi:MAG: NAD(P)-dependent alcohol dehydrogenase, partial [Pseudomonadota bacterium]
THMPKDYSFEEAATLPCAALTAWRALFVINDIRPGSTVLTQGSGGVSVFALQMAKAAGATVIATSSSDEKLAKLGELGADHLINYKEIPEWGAKVVELTGGRGVDEVVEIGGPGTLPQSIAATAVGGNISLIGVLTGWGGEVPTAEAMWKNISISGLTVGSHDHQRAMTRALEAADFRPVIDSSFPLEDISAAFKHQESQQHFGKICLTM